jgi:hypothetical protein
VAETTARIATASTDDPTRRGWIGRARRAFAFGVADLDTAAVALAGFLLRGGIVLLLLPGVVLPSAIGVAGATGVDAFGIDGRPTEWFFVIAVIAAAAITLWLLLALTVGSLIDVWLIDAALDTGRHSTRRSRPLPDLGTILDMAGIRALCMLPVVAALIWASQRLYDAIYSELTSPTNLVTPLPIRVIQSAADAVLVVALTWLAAEVVGAIATRRSVLLGSGVWRSIAGALAQIVLRPVSSVSTVIVAYGSSVLAIGLGMAATAATFDWCRVAARNQSPISATIGIGSFSTTRDFRPLVFLLAVIALIVVWIATFAASGISSVWRSAAFTGETSAAVSRTGTRGVERRLGLSGPAPERSGD